MNKERKDDSFIKKPVYEGGNQALKKFIVTHMRYPKEALEHGISGVVKLRMDIDYKGKVTKAKVISGLAYGCDEEAIRLVKLLKFKIPRNPRKLRLTFHKNMQIHFNLPTQQTIHYKIEPSSSNASEKQSGGSYHYTIEI